MKADPIVGSLEPGIYAGYFDWKDCLNPTGNVTYSSGFTLCKIKIIALWN